MLCEPPAKEAPVGELSSRGDGWKAEDDSPAFMVEDDGGDATESLLLESLRGTTESLISILGVVPFSGAVLREAWDSEEVTACGLVTGFLLEHLLQRQEESLSSHDSSADLAMSDSEGSGTGDDDQEDEGMDGSMLSPGDASELALWQEFHDEWGWVAHYPESTAPETPASRTTPHPGDHPSFQESVLILQELFAVLLHLSHMQDCVLADIQSLGMSRADSSVKGVLRMIRLNQVFPGSQGSSLELEDRVAHFSRSLSRRRKGNKEAAERCCFPVERVAAGLLFLAMVGPQNSPPEEEQETPLLALRSKVELLRRPSQPSSAVKTRQLEGLLQSTALNSPRAESATHSMWRKILPPMVAAIRDFSRRCSEFHPPTQCTGLRSPACEFGRHGDEGLEQPARGRSFRLLQASLQRVAALRPDSVLLNTALLLGLPPQPSGAEHDILKTTPQTPFALQSVGLALGVLDCLLDGGISVELSRPQESENDDGGDGMSSAASGQDEDEWTRGRVEMAGALGSLIWQHRLAPLLHSFLVHCCLPEPAGPSEASHSTPKRAPKPEPTRSVRQKLAAWIQDAGNAIPGVPFQFQFCECSGDLLNGFGQRFLRHHLAPAQKEMQPLDILTSAISASSTAADTDMPDPLTWMDLFLRECDACLRLISKSFDMEQRFITAGGRDGATAEPTVRAEFQRSICQLFSFFPSPSSKPMGLF